MEPLMFIFRLRWLFLICIILSFTAASITFYYLRHHNPSFLIGRALMCTNVAKCLAQNKHPLLAPVAKKKKLFIDYLSIEKQSLLDKGHRTTETMATQFLDYHLTFFTYNALLSLLREIFVHEEYAVTLENQTPTIIDCGSNIGISILFFKAAYPQSTIIGFEPDAANFSVLQKNITKNTLSNITLINKAVADQDGMLSFNRVSTLCAKLAQTGTTQVEAVKLSSYITKSVDLLKMDIEGAEVAVLQELHKAKKLRFIKNIIFEFHYSVTNNNHLGSVLTLLENNGFHYQIATSREWRVSFDKSTHQELTDRCLMIYAYQ